MKLFIAALGFFLLAFAGLATGLLLKRKGLRGGCGGGGNSDKGCECKKTAKSRGRAASC
ncbi:MAG TPA: hypothetical protein VIR78_15525 [Malonomonas sp.]